MERLTREDTKFNGYTHEEAIKSELDLGECLTKLADYENTKLQPNNVEKLKEKNKTLAKENRKLKKEMLNMMNYSWYNQKDEDETKSTKSLSDVWLEQEERCEQRTLEHLKTLANECNKN